MSDAEYSAARRRVAKILGAKETTIAYEYDEDELEISLAAAGELDQYQIGYSVAPDGTRLTGSGGAWQVQWLVIGIEALPGDPVFVDLADPALPVYTAPHGTGSWQPARLAESLPRFLQGWRGH